MIVLEWSTPVVQSTRPSRPLTPPCAEKRAAFVLRWGRGFSLVELVIVVAILAAVSGIVIPRFTTSAAHYRVTLAADKLAADIAWAQSRARGSSAGRKVQFVSGSRYQVAGETMSAWNAGVYEVALKASPWDVTVLSPNFGGRGVIEFDGYGRPTAGGTVKLSAGGGATRTITVFAETGAVNVTTP